MFDQKLAAKLSSKWKLRGWMIRYLPMALLTGMSVRVLEETHCQVDLPVHWWLRNPFGSVYWAVLSMAAEMSTGALLYAHIGASGIPFILVRAEAAFLKKAKSKSSYFCEAGDEIQRVLGESLNPEDVRIVILPVRATDQSGLLLAEFRFHWQLGKPITNKPHQLMN